MFDRVLILSINIGGGHFRAAQALQEAFRRLGAACDIVRTLLPPGASIRADP